MNASTVTTARKNRGMIQLGSRNHGVARILTEETAQAQKRAVLLKRGNHECPTGAASTSVEKAKTESTILYQPFATELQPEPGRRLYGSYHEDPPFAAYESWSKLPVTVETLPEVPNVLVSTPKACAMETKSRLLGTSEPGCLLLRTSTKRPREKMPPHPPASSVGTSREL